MNPLTLIPKCDFEYPRNHVVLFALILSLLFPSIPQARPLKSWMEEALQNNPEIRLSQEKINEAEAGLIEVRSYSIPRIDVGISAARTNNPLQAFGMKVMQSEASFNDFGINEFDPTNPNVGDVKPRNLNAPDAVNDFGLFIQAQVPLFTGGQLYFTREEVKAGINGAKQAKKMTDQQTLFLIIQNYAKTRGAQAYYNVASTAESTYLQLVHMVEKMSAEGLAHTSDLLSAQLKLGETQLNKREALDQSLQSLTELKRVAGISLTQEENIEKEQFQWKNESIEQSSCPEVIQRNPGLKALQHQGKMREAEIFAARANWWPQIGAQAKIETHSPDQINVDDYSYTIGLQASWNIFSGGQTYAQTSQAQARQRQWKNQHHSTAQQMIQQCEQIRRDISRAQENLTSKHQAVELATEAFRIVNHRYAEGLIPLVEWFGAQTQLQKSEADLVAAQIAFDMQNAAYLLIQGELTVENIEVK